ncbi:MAG: divergent PAP2 family protein [Candidatus Gracilibacteria bacterium]
MIAHGFFLEHILTIPIIAWCIGQVVKYIIRVGNSRFNRKYIWGSGGMPSVHSCFVLALSTAVAFKHGINSTEFAVVLSFSGIVVYDAMHVRYQSGVHATVINQLVETHSFDLSKDFLKQFPLHEEVGHTPLEVAVGMILGVFVGTLLSLY